jgi:prophage maintenance system killer protein
MTVPVQQFNVMEAIVTMLAVKFLETKGGEFTFTQDEVKKMLEEKTVRLELVKPNAPEVTDIRCTIVTVADAQKMMTQMKRVVDRTKKKGEA